MIRPLRPATLVRYRQRRDPHARTSPDPTRDSTEMGEALRVLLSPMTVETRDNGDGTYTHTIRPVEE